MAIDTPEQHEALVCALMDPAQWPEGGGDRRRIDTHISTVILAGAHAYKLKKPVDLGFLDFVSLASRRAACDEELRINGRLAPEIYEAVCAVTGSIDAPAIDGAGDVIDWAVRMRRFDPDAILSNLAGRLDADLIERLADRVAAFHAGVAVCPADGPFGEPAAVLAPMRENITQIRAVDSGHDAVLDALQAWTLAHYGRLRTVLEQRRRGGFIRECHGDLHLGNVALIDGEPVVFDAIEFNAGLRWIDTCNDVAFLFMDLLYRGRPELAWRFLDRYLQHSGDYEGVALLRFYAVYRALVRAKIAAIRLGQSPGDEAAHRAADELDGYLTLATGLTRGGSGGLLITCGVSGSGKSHDTQDLPGELGAVRLRSDIERKRLLGLAPRDDANAHGAYSAALTGRTYARLAELAQRVIEAGFIALVDATFLRREQRARFRDLAAVLQVPFAILDFDAPVDVLRARVTARRGEVDNVSDAGVEVLEAQLATREPLTAAETELSVPVRPERPLQVDALRRRMGLELSGRSR